MNLKTLVQLILLAFLLAACGGSSGSESNDNGANTEIIGEAESEDEAESEGDVLNSTVDKIRFLTQATFGPNKAAINDSTHSVSAWLLQEFAKPASYTLPIVERYREQYPEFINAEGLEEVSTAEIEGPTLAFWENAVGADDQLRQRMAFALSQILVTSNFSMEALFDVPASMGYYQDLLIKHAFGNYRDLLEDVTYSPAMGYYLTYMGNLKGNPSTGRVPDENYARELLQLFTIGLVELNSDGSPVTDGQGNAVETYSNQDITGLARVFTGLDRNYELEEEVSDAAAWSSPMIITAANHSSLEKSFLGLTIPANTSAQQSITMALDHIFNHDNVGPFLSRQLIQRFVTANPSHAYIERVAGAFNSGSYILADGSSVGVGRRGDLKATLAAVLMDQEARQVNTDQQFGKLREPVLRLSHWARAFNVNNTSPAFQEGLFETFTPETLNQHPYRSPSVFNFYRPGYVAPGTLSGQAGLTQPEFQITNASTITGYSNFIMPFIRQDLQSLDDEELQEIISELGATTATVADARNSWAADYSSELALANNPASLVDSLNQLLTYNSLFPETRQRIIDAVSAVPLEENEGVSGETQRVHLAIHLIMTSPEYLVQR